jgi:hypothetical protein
MNLKRFIVFCFLFSFSFSFSTISQIDSVKEITIYEYDTIYLQPDTIRLIDTVIDIVKIPPINKKKSTFEAYYPPHLILNSFGFHIYSYFAGNLIEERVTDSLYSKPVFNYAISGQINFQKKKLQISVGVGFAPFQEKQYFKYNSYVLKTDSTGMSDSLLITNKSNYLYHINYLNLNVLIGRKWRVNKKWTLSLDAGFFADILIGYKQGNTNKHSSLIQKVNLSFGLSPTFYYRERKKTEFFISPFYQHSIMHKKDFPYTTFQKIGIGAGFNIYFKKR